MAKDLKKMQKRMNKFADFSIVLNNILKSMETAILNLNRDQMYEDGVMDISNPSAILHYAPSTIKSKKRIATFSRTDHITLKWEGDFHKTLKIRFDVDSFLIFSEDKKWKSWLQPQDRFDNALGLTDESVDLLKEWITFKLIKQFRKAI